MLGLHANPACSGCPTATQTGFLQEEINLSALQLLFDFRNLIIFKTFLLIITRGLKNTWHSGTKTHSLYPYSNKHYSALNIIFNFLNFFVETKTQTRTSA